MMSYLLSNQLFSELANAYHITPLARTSPSSYATVIEQVVTGGAMFEAHVDKSRFLFYPRLAQTG